MGTRKRYDQEFKLQAAKLVVEQGYTLRDAAARLGATAWSIGEWVRKFRAAGKLPPASQPVAEAEELKDLRKDNRRLRMENEILKKAAAYFAKESL
jgi:transposase-like protein